MHMMITLAASAGVENIGAAAQAVRTMGFGELRIVDSQAHLELVARWVAHGSGDIIDNIKAFKTLAEPLHDADLTITTTVHDRTKYHYYVMPVELMPLLEEKSPRMSHAALVFGRESSGLTNEGLTLTDALTSVPMVVDYPSLSLGQAVVICCYQLATLIQQPAKSGTTVDQRQLQASCGRTMTLLAALAMADDIKLIDWLQQCLGLLEQRDTAMLHRLLHDIEKNITK